MRRLALAFRVYGRRPRALIFHPACFLPTHVPPQQRPVAQTLCGALQKEPNCKCLLLSVLIYTCLAAVTWCRCANVTKVRMLPDESTSFISHVSYKSHKCTFYLTHSPSPPLFCFLSFLLFTDHGQLHQVPHQKHEARVVALRRGLHIHSGM